MPKAINFSIDSLKKFKEFFDHYQKDPSQNVELLCDHLKLQKSRIYTFCKQIGITLADLRDGKEDYSDTLNRIFKERISDLKEYESKAKSTGGRNVVPKEDMEAVVQKVDELRSQGLSAEEAVAKAKLPLHFSTYYVYRRKLAKLANKPVATRSKQKKDIEIKKTSIMPAKRSYKPRHKKDLPIKDVKDIIVATQDTFPMIPHTIEYIQPNDKKKKPAKEKEMIMMIGNAEALLDFIKKMKGDTDG